MEFSFTQSEVAEIQKKLSLVVDNWARNLINHILKMARDAGVDSVYMNTVASISGNIQSDSKLEYFYESLPRSIGFKLEDVDRSKVGKTVNGGKMWAMHFSLSASLIEKLKKISQRGYSLEEIPKQYQGAVLSIIGKKTSYTMEELKKVLAIVSKKAGGQKQQGPSFYYDWSKIWSGGQKFLNNINETVVLQKISVQTKEMVLSNPALTKFWSFVLSQSQHFDPDTIGFALVCKINKNIWIINEVQTDVINQYRKLVNMIEPSGNKVDIETLKDMLEANNRKNWIPYLESNEEFRHSLLQNPDTMHQLCDDSVDIKKWIQEQTGGNQITRRLELIQNTSSPKIFLVG